MEGFQPPETFAALIVALILTIANGLAIFITRSAASGTLDFTSMAGIKTAATRHSQAAWEAGHSAALPWAYFGNGAGVVLAVASFFASQTVVPYLAVLAACVLASLTAVIGGWIVAHRAAFRVAKK